MNPPIRLVKPPQVVHFPPKKLQKDVRKDVDNFNFRQLRPQFIDLSEKSITLIMLTDINLEQSVIAYKQCMKLAKFTDYKFVSSHDVQLDGVKTIKLDTPMQSRSDYSKVVLSRLNEFVDTNFVLICQYDGFIVNPKAWTDSFLAYDYIGAPCYWSPQIRTGNGGFSLRSKKLLKVISENQSIFKMSGECEPEDRLLCFKHYDFFSKHRIKFAELSLASNFAWQRHNKSPWNCYTSQFGIHTGCIKDEYLKYIF